MSREMAASKYSYNLCTETERPSTSASATLTPGIGLISRLTPVRVMTTVVGRMFRSPSTSVINPSATQEEPTVTSQEQMPDAHMVNDEDSRYETAPTPDEEMPVSSSHPDQEDCTIITESEEMSDQNVRKKGAEEKFYEKILEEEYARLTEFVEEMLPASDDPKEDLIGIYRAQIHALHDKVKELQSKLEEVEDNSRKEREELLKKHEDVIEHLKKLHEAEICSITQQNWELVDEIIRSQIDEIQLWRSEFDMISERKGEPDASVPTKNAKVAQELLGKFKELNTAQQGIVVAGMGIVALVVGYYSWPFLSWAWPRLVSFAARIEIATVAGWIFAMINSKAYKDFMKAWEDGEPLGPAFFTNFGPEIKSSIIGMAPQLFRMGRTMLVKA